MNLNDNVEALGFRADIFFSIQLRQSGFPKWLLPRFFLAVLQYDAISSAFFHQRKQMQICFFFLQIMHLDSL